MSEPDSGSSNNGQDTPPKPSWRERIKARLFSRKKSLRTDLTEVLAETPDPKGGAEFTPAEQTMLQNVLALRERRVADVMIARSEMVAVRQAIAIGELLQTFTSAGHSRLVVYGETLDDPTGMVHIRDLVAYLTIRATAAPSAASSVARKHSKRMTFDPKALDLSQPLLDTKIVRRILYVPPSMPAVDLLVKMQATRIHLALVIDEYGGTDGLVSIEDLVEEIVGDIEDEHDDEDSRIVALGDGSFLADARASLQEAAEIIGAGFEIAEQANEVDTLGGLLVMLAARVPLRGEILRGAGDFDFEVIDADPRRVKRVRIYRRPPDPPKRERKRRPKSETANVSAIQGTDNEPSQTGPVDNRSASG